MKKRLLVILLLANSVAFAGIRLQDGDLIMEGDNYVKLSKLGSPAGERSYMTTDPNTGNYAKAFEYTYKREDGYYTVTVINGKITEISWSR